MHDDTSRDRPLRNVTHDGDSSRDRPVDRMTVPEAAEALGVTQSAIRKRVQRGSIHWDKDHEGRVYVCSGSVRSRAEPRSSSCELRMNILTRIYIAALYVVFRKIVGV